MLEITLYAVVGAFAGLVAGLLGVGGGIVNVPALDLIFTRQGIATDIAFRGIRGVVSESAAHATA